MELIHLAFFKRLFLVRKKLIFKKLFFIECSCLCNQFSSIWLKIIFQLWKRLIETLKHCRQGKKKRDLPFSKKPPKHLNFFFYSNWSIKCKKVIWITSRLTKTPYGFFFFLSYNWRLSRGINWKIYPNDKRSIGLKREREEIMIDLLWAGVSYDLPLSFFFQEKQRPMTLCHPYHHWLQRPSVYGQTSERLHQNFFGLRGNIEKKFELFLFSFCT